jgi:hypothetical protein
MDAAVALRMDVSFVYADGNSNWTAVYKRYLLNVKTQTNKRNDSIITATSKPKATLKESTHTPNVCTQVVSLA